MTFSLDGARHVIDRDDLGIAWGIGCHPRIPKAQHTFDIRRFREMLDKTAIVGEIGLDSGSRVPMELQLENFRCILQAVAGLPRLVSIHSYRTTALVLSELSRQPISVPVLHWWTGSAAETAEAVQLGCYFSIHSAVARQSKFRTRVPPGRILLESDHGYPDPPAAIPCRIQWVEYLVAQQLRMRVEELRALAWHNLAVIVKRTGTRSLFPPSFSAVFSGLGL
jgi:TatD DNase family protein